MYQIARISSVCVNIPKYAMYICAPKQRTLCVASSITLKSQAASSTALVNYTKILPLKYTTNRLQKYIYNGTKKYKMFIVCYIFIISAVSYHIKIHSFCCLCYDSSVQCPFQSDFSTEVYLLLRISISRIIACP